MSNLISATEASRRLGISIWTLYRWVGSGSVASIRLGKKMLFDPEDLDKLIERNRTVVNDVSRETK